MFDQGAFNSALATKYDILRQQANSGTTTAEAQARLADQQGRLLNAQTGQVAPNAASQRELQGAQGFALGQQGYLAGAEAGQVGANAAAQRELERAQGGFLGQQTTNLAENENGFLSPEETGFGHNILSRISRNLGVGNATRTSTPSVFSPNTQPASAYPPSPLGYAEGTARVPGHDTGVDQVPAMLRPKEAVLNPHAADLIGRDKIATANAIGMAHEKAHAAPQGSPQAAPQAPGKGMIPPHGQAGPGASVKPAGKPAAKPAIKHQQFSGGTHMVGHGKSAKTPTKIDPAALLGLLGSLKGGQPAQPVGQPAGGMGQATPGGMV